MFIYSKELKEFNKAKVKYIIVGGIAFNLLGGMRSTADLDILIDMEHSNLTKVLKILGKQGYRQLQPIDPMDLMDQKKCKELIRKKNMKTLSFLKDNSLNQVDIIFDSPVSFDKAKQNIIMIKIVGTNLPVIGLEELMTMKKAAWRPIDQADIVELKVLRKLRKSNGK